MFLSFFLLNFGPIPGRRTLRDVAAGYDLFFGRSPRYQREWFAKQVETILSVDSFPRFFAVCRLACPPKAQFAQTLRDAVRASLRKGYHTARTDFSRIQASGVSTILLKGESFTAPPNLRRVHLDESWLRARDGVFLDASCLAYRGKGWSESEFAGYVDWNCNVCLEGTIMHSGDVLDDNKQSGRHRIEIDLERLPRDITSLYFTISAYTGTLRHIQQPFLSIHDPDTMVGEQPLELCRYNLESAVASAAAAQTCIVMCKLQRMPRTGGQSDQWSVVAIGQLGPGRARVSDRAGSGSMTGYFEIRKQIAERGPFWK